MLKIFIYVLKFYLQRFSIIHSTLHIFKFIFLPYYRKNFNKEMQRLQDWNDKHGHIIDSNLGEENKGIAIIFGWSQFEYALSESLVRKSLEKAGFVPLILATPSPLTRLIYKTLGVKKIVSFNKYIPIPNIWRAKKIIKSFNNSQDLIDYKYNGVSVGKYSSSSYMRQTRSGRIDIKDNKTINTLSKHLAISISSARASKSMIDILKPSIIVVIDRGYSPFGEVFDSCINNSIDIITWNIAHRDNSIMLKRYNEGNRTSHPSSLSSKSWNKIKNLKSKNLNSEDVMKELEYCYSSGEWYSEVGTQFNKTQQSVHDISNKLDLDGNKKTAVIFAHIFWDATFFWGEDLFQDYEEWFLESVKAACLNPNLNWIIKVHPANLVKNFRDGITEEPSEVSALNKFIGKLPSHVKLLAADSDISTWSLFEVMDYCLTVRGTVGIEAALLGKTVLTAGTGRYDRHGFTVDFNDRKEYLEALNQLERINYPDSKSIELAAKYATGVFVDRPLFVTSFNISHKKDNSATLSADVLVSSSEELGQSQDIISIASWLLSKDEDHLN